MFSVCVPFLINYCQVLCIQYQLFQVLYIQSTPAFQKSFCCRRFLLRIKPLKEQRKLTQWYFKPDQYHVAFGLLGCIGFKASDLGIYPIHKADISISRTK